MFTGIVAEIGKVTSVQASSLVISAKNVLQGIEVGGSIAVNGVCLTITDFDSSSFSVDIMPETIERTNLGKLGFSDEVNLEQPLTLAKPLGGHLVQGHIDGTGRVASLTWEREALIMGFEAPPKVINYLVEKGFIAIDGVSLTVVAKDASSFKVSIVDFTCKHTILGSRRVGDIVNLEVDIIAKYVEQLSQPRSAGITGDFLREHGFLAS